MKKLIILVGPQGSGKTEYCKTIGTYFRVSQDERGRWHKELFDEAIKKGVPLIVVDKTNPGTKQRKRYIEPAKEANYYIQIIWFDVDRGVCLKRIIGRTDHPTLKPEKAEEALSDYFSKFEEPTKKEADEVLKWKQKLGYSKLGKQ